ncbi:MAG: hypothetical protein LUF30_04615 [Lachnospiraceae bacterium]|nr:hypothetical protein [Lachnospiraceae bacterium]
MNANIISKKKMLCVCCMEEHEVTTVRMREHTVFKGTSIDYLSEAFYCDRADEYFMDERMLYENDIRKKEAFRRKTGLSGTDHSLA